MVVVCRRCLHSLFNPSVPVAISQLVNERRYLERLSSSPIFVKNHASPTAVHDRDLRYEELLTKAVTIAPHRSAPITSSEAWAVFQSFRKHGQLTTWAYNKLLRYDADYGGLNCDDILKYMNEDGVRPDVHTYNFLLSGGDRFTGLHRSIKAIPNRATFLIRLEAASQKKDIETAISIFEEICARGIVLDDDDAVFQLMKKFVKTESDLRRLRRLASLQGYDSVKWMRRPN